MNTHIDDDAVDQFAAAMKAKLAAARARGRSGWHECPPANLAAMLREHVEKGDPLDVANFCMFLWSLGHPIATAPTQPAHDAVQQVLAELDRATAKFPTWPSDPLHALAVLGEEFGELTKDMLQLTYEPHKTNPHQVRTEALQTAAMALRLFMSLDRYEYRAGAQHSQRELAA